MASTETADERMLVGAWVRFDLPEQPVIAFTYVDAQAGFSAGGWRLNGSDVDQSERMVLRLPIPALPWRRLEPHEVQALGLESTPTWVAEFYGPQPLAGRLWGEWRDHVKLQGRFLPEHPDDLQVLVHDGGPRITKHQPEVVWVSVCGMDGDVFRGRVLNQPHHLTSVRQGNVIQFVAAEGSELPVMVTEKYLAERNAWAIRPCHQCGFSELFDAPSDLIRVVFPNLPEGGQMSGLTAFCPLCRGVQTLTSRRNVKGKAKEVEPPAAPQPKKPWWRFW